MKSLLQEYRKLLLFLGKNRNRVSNQERKILVGRICSLEKRLVGTLMKRMLTGAITLNLSHVNPPRLRKLLLIALNRRLHIIHFLDSQNRMNIIRAKTTEEELRTKLSLLEHRRSYLSQLEKQASNRNKLSSLQMLESIHSKKDDKSLHTKKEINTVYKYHAKGI